MTIYYSFFPILISSLLGVYSRKLIRVHTPFIPNYFSYLIGVNAPIYFLFKKHFALLRWSDLNLDLFRLMFPFYLDLMLLITFN